MKALDHMHILKHIPKKNAGNFKCTTSLALLFHVASAHFTGVPWPLWPKVNHTMRNHLIRDCCNHKGMLYPIQTIINHPSRDQLRVSTRQLAVSSLSKGISSTLNFHLSMELTGLKLATSCTKSECHTDWAILPAYSRDVGPRAPVGNINVPLFLYNQGSQWYLNWNKYLIWWKMKCFNHLSKSHSWSIHLLLNKLFKVCLPFITCKICQIQLLNNHKPKRSHACIFKIFILILYIKISALSLSYF